MEINSHLDFIVKIFVEESLYFSGQSSNILGSGVCWKDRGNDKERGRPPEDSPSQAVYVAEDDLEFLSVQPPPPYCWGCKAFADGD